MRIADYFCLSCMVINKRLMTHQNWYGVIHTTGVTNFLMESSHRIFAVCNASFSRVPVILYCDIYFAPGARLNRLLLLHLYDIDCYTLHIVKHYMGLQSSNHHSSSITDKINVLLKLTMVWVLWALVLLNNYVSCSQILICIVYMQLCIHAFVN